MYPKPTQSLYDPKHEHDACGVGFVANINGQREHRILAYALQALSDLEESKRVQALIHAHLENTESPRAGEILRHWDEKVMQFWRVLPRPARAKPAEKAAAVPMAGRSNPAIVDGFENSVAQLAIRTD